MDHLEGPLGPGSKQAFRHFAIYNDLDSTVSDSLNAMSLEGIDLRKIHLPLLKGNSSLSCGC